MQLLGNSAGIDECSTVLDGWVSTLPVSMTLILKKVYGNATLETGQAWPLGLEPKVHLVV